MNEILTLLWLFLPAGLANTGPVIAARIPVLASLNYPLDAYKSYRGVRIFGDHKTVRGVIAAIVVGGLVAVLQMLLYGQFSQLQNYSQQVDYSSPLVILMGLAMGFGAISGDATKSYFKRRRNLPPGSSWVPFDQLDFVVGAAITSLPFVQLAWGYYLPLIVIGLVLHPTFNLLSWLLGLQEKPY